eukprot:TRINITY_DN2988_c0_g1_i2.p1 TRINITY_DN2988_c0_g1~~TRINITY_DN2988_c0_g1_i2.p1  ORF type:complete len:155 (-),score=39.03 TRINITY_DN2988_c0_g1_i2:34-435(-)
MSAAPPQLIDNICLAFVKHYYATFEDVDTRPQLASLYHDVSMLSYVDKKFQGRESIMRFFMEGVKFESISHNVLTLDVQPSGCGGLIALVSGNVLVDECQNPLYFTHMFHLIPVDGDNKQFWVHNEIFKLNYG